MTTTIVNTTTYVQVVGASCDEQYYYVDYTGGNDSLDGRSAANAWKTITKVNSVTFVPGDHILFKCGEVWQGLSLIVTGSGTAAKPIVYSKYGTGANPVIDDCKRFTDFTLYSGSTWRRAFTPAVRQVFEDGVRMTQGTSTTLTSGQWYNTGGYVYVRCSDDGNPNSGHTIEHHGDPNGNHEYLIYFDDHDYITFDGVDIFRGYDGFTWSYKSDGSPVVTTYYSTVKNCTMSWFARRAISVGGGADHDRQHLLITNCVFHDNEAEAVMFDAYNSEFSYNEIYDGMKDWYKFAPNYIDVGGFTAGIRCYGNLIHHNYIHDIYNGLGIEIEHEAGFTRPHDNYIYDNLILLNVAKVQPTSYITGMVDHGNNDFWYNNIVIDSIGTNDATLMAVTNGGINSHWYHNTFILTTVPSGWGDWLINLGATSSYVTLKNNIFYGVGNARIAWLDSASNLVANRNDYYGTTGIQFRYPDDTYQTSLAAWRTKSGQDANSINADPAFVANYSNRHLTVGSPCRNIGENLQAVVPADYDGVSRDTVPDVGAYEYV